MKVEVQGAHERRALSLRSASVPSPTGSHAPPPRLSRLPVKLPIDVIPVELPIDASPVLGLRVLPRPPSGDLPPRSRSRRHVSDFEIVAELKSDAQRLRSHATACRAEADRLEGLEDPREAPEAPRDWSPSLLSPPTGLAFRWASHGSLTTLEWAEGSDVATPTLSSDSRPRQKLGAGAAVAEAVERLRSAAQESEVAAECVEAQCRGPALLPEVLLPGGLARHEVEDCVAVSEFVHAFGGLLGIAPLSASDVVRACRSRGTSPDLISLVVGVLRVLLQVSRTGPVVVSLVAGVTCVLHAARSYILSSARLTAPWRSSARGAFDLQASGVGARRTPLARTRRPRGRG